MFKDENGTPATGEKQAGYDSGGSQRKGFETVLRVMPIGLCISALVLMVQSKQSNEYGDVHYSKVGAFRYLAYANGICAGYSLLSAFGSAATRSYSLCRAWVGFFFDQLLAYVMLGAGAVGAQVVYLAYEGDDEVTWGRVCDMYGRFCYKAGASLVITFVAVLCLVLLSVLSAYRLFSTYEPPAMPKEHHITAHG